VRGRVGHCREYFPKARRESAGPFLFVRPCAVVLSRVRTAAIGGHRQASPEGER
jgi:hypothetical protein